MSRTIKVLLAEDQAMVREALAALLGLEEDIEVVAQVARGDEVLDAARAHGVDVALLDIEMPGATGIEAAALVHRELPAVKLVVLTTFGRPGYLRSAMESGADAFLVKDAPAAQLAEAVRRVLAGSGSSTRPWRQRPSPRAPTPSPTANARSSAPPPTAPPTPNSPPPSTSPRARSATTCPRPSRNWP